ncbi:hypothetical protein ACFQ6N_37525 [Kitasatospora sp. NPDC056446]
MGVRSWAGTFGYSGAAMAPGSETSAVAVSVAAAEFSPVVAQPNPLD